MPHTVIMDQNGIRHWSERSATPNLWSDLAAGLDGLDGAPVTLSAFTDLGQDRVTMPFVVSELVPLPQVLPSGHEVALWPALVAQDPPVMIPTAAPIAGLLNLAPEFDGVICMVADATHWIRISAGEACYAQSDLSRSLVGPPFSFTLNENDLRAGFGKTNGRSSALGTELARAKLAETPNPSHNLGLAMGAEFAAAKPYWLGQAVTVLAEEPLLTAYSLMLNDMGCQTAAMSLYQANNI